MTDRDPERNFEELWKTFHDRYPFFELRNVDWGKQYDTYRPRVTRETSDDELFDIFCRMLDPLDDGGNGGGQIVVRRARGQPVQGTRAGRTGDQTRGWKPEPREQKQDGQRDDDDQNEQTRFASWTFLGAIHGRVAGVTPRRCRTTVVNFSIA